MPATTHPHVAHAPSTVPPGYEPEEATGDCDPLVRNYHPYQNDVGQDLLRLQVANNARDFLVSNRPPACERFTGNKDGTDFENTLNWFELVTTQVGVTDLQRFMELRHYFAGPAGTVCSLYERERDPVKGLKDTLAHLKQEYGRKNMSAQRMLDELLSGKEISANDHQGLQTFRLALEKTYKRAVETNRHATFDSQDTINQILRKRLKFAGKRWGIERAKKRKNWDDDDDTETEPKFTEFLDFLKLQSLIHDEQDTVFGKPQNTTVGGVPKKYVKDGYFDVCALNSSSGPNASVRGNRGSSMALVGSMIPTRNVMKKAPYNPGRGAFTPAFGGLGCGSFGFNRGGNNAPMRGGFHPSRGAFTPSNQPTRPPTTQGVPPRQPSGLGAVSKGANLWACLCCKGTSYHKLQICPTFNKKSVNERISIVKASSLCMLCLCKGHFSPECKSPSRCDTCNGRHHTLTHMEKSPVANKC